MIKENPDNLDIVLLAGNARGRDELYFTIVNRSVAVRRYDRASLWTTGWWPGVVAVSGNEKADPRASFGNTWSAALRDLKYKRIPSILTADSFRNPKTYANATAKTETPSVAWVPLPKRKVGVLFERWGGEPFGKDDLDELDRLMRAYSLVWKGKRGVGGVLKWFRLIFWASVLAALVVAAVVVRLPLRVVADCEVTAMSPRLISAPMDGVVDEVLVSPGQQVNEGDRLAVYDSRLMEEELKISRRQVEVVEAELASARARGFADSRYRGETALLEARLEQELARLEALEVRFSRRVVTAPTAGMVQLDDARAWRGRPVSTGQAILWLVDPDDTRLTIWLPQDDRIDIDPKMPVKVHLYAMGGQSREATLTYVSSFAQPTPDGGYAFPAEAVWSDKGKSPPLGLRGSASLYGEEVSLGYWLFRRPMAWVRRWAGI